MNAGRVRSWRAATLALALASGVAACLGAVEGPVRAAAELGDLGSFVTLLEIGKLLGGLAVVARRLPHRGRGTPPPASEPATALRSRRGRYAAGRRRRPERS
jgi:hypothetical protein